MVLSILVLWPAFSESTDSQEQPVEFKNALGVYASSAAGDPVGGLHYQRWGERAGFQVTAGGYYNPDESWGRILDVGFSADYLFTVYKNNYKNQLSGRLYLWVSSGMKWYIDSKWNRSYDIDEEDVESENQTPVVIGILGAGIGIETVINEHFSFPVQFGYMGQFMERPKVQFSVGGGFRYRY